MKSNHIDLTFKNVYSNEELKLFKTILVAYNIVKKRFYGHKRERLRLFNKRITLDDYESMLHYDFLILIKSLLIADTKRGMKLLLDMLNDYGVQLDSGNRIINRIIDGNNIDSNERSD